jgi:hypothetical protein
LDTAVGVCGAIVARVGDSDNVNGVMRGVDKGRLQTDSEESIISILDNVPDNDTYNPFERVMTNPVYGLSFFVCGIDRREQRLK